MKTMKTFFTLVAALLINLAAFCQTGSELIFQNPVLVSGTANQQGAMYRFSNITTGVDAEIKIKKFSRNDIVMSTIDNSALGWNKAFQPQFGLSGTVAPFQDWHIDFEMTFYQAGTNTKRTMDSIVLTALDVDGDNQSIQEYVIYDKPASITYSIVSSLTSTATGYVGQIVTCDQHTNYTGPLQSCNICGGDGIDNGQECSDCEGSGRRHDNCNCPYRSTVGTKVSGPVTNFVNIDTLGTQVMSTYRYYNKKKIRFTYGAKTGALSTSAGIRLNSTWFKQFSLLPLTSLPVKLASFTATLNKNTNNADLKWTTASETNLSHFMIERSTDGTNFSDAGMVFAYSNTVSKSDYAFTDNISNIQSVIVYYRLHSVDIGGKSQYSETRIIRISKQADNKITILTYPNPVTNELRVTIPSSWQNKKVIYEVFNANGQVSKKTETGSSSQTETLNVNSLAPGFYIVRVTCNGETAEQKIVKQ